MLLARIFELNHTMGLLKGTERRAVEHGGAFHFLRDEAVDVVGCLHEVKEDDLGEVVGEDEAKSNDWKPDHKHCWCKACTSDREMLRTTDE